MHARVWVPRGSSAQGGLLEGQPGLPPSLAAAQLPRPTLMRLWLFIGVHCGDRGGTARGLGWGKATGSAIGSDSLEVEPVCEVRGLGGEGQQPVLPHGLACLLSRGVEEMGSRFGMEGSEASVRVTGWRGDLSSDWVNPWVTAWRGQCLGD